MKSQDKIFCPVCKSGESRRSRRRNARDYILGVAGILPWRCEGCGTRFYARAVPLRHMLYAHCRFCGNVDLQCVSLEHVPGVTSVLGRILGVTGFRCEPCRHRFVSIRPLLRENEQGAGTAVE